MTRVFTWQFEVRAYELDDYGHIHTATYHNYLEEGATRASADTGHSHQWYFERRRAWVVRKMSIRYFAPLYYGERVTLRTWVSDFSRVYSHREYDLRCAADDQPVARARAKWVYVNLDTMYPERIPLEFKDAFDPSGEQEDLGIHLDAPEMEQAPGYVTRRRVQRHELDSAHHVNNSIYVSWFEQALTDAFASAGWPAARLQNNGAILAPVAREIDYLMPALDGMTLEIVSRPVVLAPEQSAWLHEVCDCESGNILARDYVVVAPVSCETGEPCALPEQALDAILAGSVVG